MLEILSKIIIPYRLATIQRLNLSETQKLILKCDLHFSHYEPKVLEFMKANYIEPFYVPGRCTDVLHVVLNKPLKQGMKSAFRDYLHALFNKHIAAGLDASVFKPNLGMKALKQEIVGFVETGLALVRTEEFAAVIRKSFAEDGCFAEMRSPERRAAAQQQINARQVLRSADVIAAIPAGEIVEPKIEDEDEDITDELLRQLGTTTLDDDSSDSDCSSD